MLQPGRSLVKYGVLLVLVLQNSGLTLTMRYSRITAPTSNLYISSTAVVLAELIKLVWSFLLFLRIDCNSSLARVFISLR